MSEDLYSVPDLEQEFACSKKIKSSGFTLLMKWTLLTKQHPELHEIIKDYLLANPEEINKQNKEGWTALMLAARNSGERSTERTVKILIGAGAALNIQSKNDWTALMIATGYSNNDSTEKTVEMLIKAGANLNLQSGDGWTALMIAAWHSNNDSTEKIVEMLIKAGANLNIQGGDGWTALMLAAGHSNNNSTEKTVEMLIGAGADLNCRLNEGPTALMIALRNLAESNYSNENTVKTLIRAGADLNLLDNSGYNYLIHAAEYANKEIFRELIEKGAKIELNNMSNQIILETMNEEDIFFFLVHHPVNPKEIMRSCFSADKIILVLEILFKLKEHKKIKTKVIKMIPTAAKSFREDYKLVSLPVKKSNIISFEKIAPVGIQILNCYKEKLTKIPDNIRFLLDINGEEDGQQKIKEYCSLYF